MRPVGQFSEDQLIARISRFLPQDRDIALGPGDDCAIVRAADGKFLVSTDVLVQGRHFRLDWISARQLGARALAQNLADIAAMGGRPTAVVVALTVPGHLPVSWLEDLAAGLGAAGSAAGVSIAGGDLVRGSEVSLAVTVLGSMDGVAPVLRSGARVGDVVAHAGNTGWGAAGFALLEAGEREGKLVAAHLVPQPPLAAGVAAARAGATAMLDVSDGLLRDAGRLAAASDVTLDLDEVALARWEAPLRDAALRTGGDAQSWVLTGGEDHGLLATFPAGTALPPTFTEIGRVRAAEPEFDQLRVTIAGQPAQIPPGWDHFGG